jgi:hypothetical protein
MLPTETFQIRGKKFKNFPDKPEVKGQSVFENCDLSSYGVLCYIMNSFCINVFQLLRLYILLHKILKVVYIFLLLSMYSYCSSMYSYRCLCILIVVYVFLLFVYVFLSLSMYNYCCLHILRRGDSD